MVALIIPAVLLWLSPACAVSLSMHVAMAPLRTLSVKVTLTPGERGARLLLSGPEGEETASDVQTDRKTSWIEWTNLALPAGDYTITLSTTSGCRATDRLTVAGDPA